MPLRFSLLAAGTIAAAAAALVVGGTALAPSAVFHSIIHPDTGDVATIVWQLRLPRIVMAAIAGASLAIAGGTLQGLLRNPLVDPYLTGVSAGAAVAIVLSIAAGIAASAVPAIGFAAGLITAVIVAALSRRGTGLDSTRLILAGVSLSAFFAAIIALVLTRTQGGGGATAIVSWLAGTLAGRSWPDAAFAAPYAALGALLAFISAPALNALRLGDVRAASVGVNVGRAQWIILASASLLAASAVTLSGTVGFVGLIVPHVARRFVGSDARFSLAACALLGAALMILADALSRTLLAPAEIPIGVLLAFIGVPAFLYLYARETAVRTV